ncbi:MAG: ThiF family adenylyltransferase [bacterium]
MSQQLINHSPDLKKLRDEGFEVKIKSGYLLISGVPYLNFNKEIKNGILVSKLALTGDKTIKPDTHVVFFVGEYPCHKNGLEIEQIRHDSREQTLVEDLIINHSFSNKPRDGYTDYYEKMSRYVDIISAPAQTIDSSVTAKTFKIIESDDEEFVFHYIDTNSSRAEIMFISDKLKNQKIGIVGLGGTGSYILDFISKTPIKEIHLFDGDIFAQHNAFRAPGAASKEKLSQNISKIQYLKEVYSNMHKNIVLHPGYLNQENINLLPGLDFFFICIDKGEIKEEIFNRLIDQKIPFIDTGMGIEIVGDKLIGIVRATLSKENRRDHIAKRVSFFDRKDENYSNNIQIAELNALNAALAVIKWKKLNGLYNDQEKECHNTYTIDLNMLLSDDHET